MLAALSLTVAAPAQGTHAVHLVGQADVAWANTTGQGTPILATRVLYPSTTGGVNAPLEPRVGGWPVIVFLHGFALLGRDYGDLASQWVGSGFAVVLVDTAMFAFFDEANDAIAQFAAIGAANADPSSPFVGAFDMQRVALAGHSMGGGALAVALATNPGYRCAFALAPAFPGTTYTHRVAVPMGLAVGKSDVVTPWYFHAYPYYETLLTQSGLRTWMLLDAACDHMNIAGLAGASDPCFARVVDVTTGFFRHFLDIDANGLDRVLGPCIEQSHQVVFQHTSVVQPRLWADQPLALGTTVRISLATDGGPGAILAAPSVGWATPTSLGTLLLDPLHTYTWTVAVALGPRMDATLVVPNLPALVGTPVAMQGLGSTIAVPLRFGSAAQFVVVP